MTSPHELYPDCYDLCPLCGQPKHRQSLRCRNCKFKRPDIVQPDDPTIRLIPLTKGQVVTVSAHRYHGFAQFKWLAFAQKRGGVFHYYAKRGIHVKGTLTCVTVWMHREILGLDGDDKRRADHINGNTLDNRDENLRIVTVQQNRANSAIPETNKSGFKGVCWHKTANKWIAYITAKGKRMELGRFDKIEDAAAARCEAELKYFGEFARIENKATL